MHLFCSLEEKIVNQSYFFLFWKVQTHIKNDKLAELLKIYFKRPVKRLKLSTLVAKSYLRRFQIHQKWEKNNPS